MKPRRNYDINIIIDGKQRGLSGEVISRKLGGIITSWQVNYLWRKHKLDNSAKLEHSDNHAPQKGTA